MKVKRSWIYALVCVDSSCCFETPSFASAGGLGRRPLTRHHHAAANAESTEDMHQLHELLLLADVNPKDCQIKPLSGAGFCNALYTCNVGKTNKKVRAPTVMLCANDVRDCADYHYLLVHKHTQMVAKLFSTIAKRRMRIHGTHVDWMASKQGLGPKLFASTSDGILMEWLEGEGLNETIVHTTSDWIETVATSLAAFHYTEIPPSHPHMLWETMEIMMDMMIPNKEASLVRDEVMRQRELLEPLHLPIVLGHGDLKPSNIIGGRFIDFEVSGMHYRGFDLAKLFRTDHPTELSDDNLNAFLECYLRASPETGGDCTRDIEQLKLETKLMEPLTVCTVRLRLDEEN